MARPVITVIGSFAVGLWMRTSHMPVFGETLIGSGFDMGPGGKGSNQAVGVARLGAEACFANIIGNDKLGEIATSLYAEEGVDTTYLQKTDQMATGAGFIVLNEEGENAIILDMGSNELMDTAFVDRIEEQISRSDMVMSVLEIPVPAAARAMELGRKHGVRTILNPAPAAELDDRVLGNVSYLTPNETELRILVGRPPDDPTPTSELAARLRERGVETLVVTMGEKGALVLSSDGSVAVPAPTVDVVDTTGAGDAFNAALAVALAEGSELREAVEFANCAGAHACTTAGVIPALATRDILEGLRRQTY